MHAQLVGASIPKLILGCYKANYIIRIRDSIEKNMYHICRVVFPKLIVYTHTKNHTTKGTDALKERYLSGNILYILTQKQPKNSYSNNCFIIHLPQWTFGAKMQKKIIIGYPELYFVYILTS